MNIVDIKERVNQRNKHYVYESEHEVQYHHDIIYLLSIIEQQKNLLNVVESMVDEMRKPIGKTESGATKLIIMETLIQRYLYYKQHPSELKSFLQAIRGDK